MTKKHTNNKKLIAITALVATVLIGGVAAYFALRPGKKTSNDGINYAPATAEEKKAAEDNKEQIVKDQASQSATGQAAQNQTGDKKLSVVVTSASANEVSAYVSGVLEENGTCSAVFTQGSTTITRTSQGFANVSYTQCAPITPDLPNNNGWSVVINYSSSSGKGSSQAKTF